MDNNNQNPNPGGQVPNTQQEDKVVQNGQHQVQEPIQITPKGKENVSVAIPKPQEWIEETAPEAVVTEELEKAGVEATKSEVLEIPTDVNQAGVKPTGTAVPVPKESQLKFPLTEEKAKGILKMHKRVKESITWLAMLVVRQFQMLKFGEKNR